MFDCNMIQYLTIIAAVLLFISLFFNFKFIIIAKRESENAKELIKSAYFNIVTELPNKANIIMVLNEQIDRSLRHNQTFIVTVIKVLNYHDVKIRSQELANQFMLEASNRLLDSVRDEDIVGHITDDGFVIVFNEYLNEENYKIVTDRIKAAFVEKPHINTKYQIVYDISLGQSVYPQDGTDATLLIDRATHNALK